MDLSGVAIKPAEGMLALKFVDDIDDEPPSNRSPSAIGAPASSPDYEGLLAVVLGVGPKVTVAKKGDTVITRPYARDGLSIGDNMVLVDAYCIVATLK